MDEPNLSTPLPPERKDLFDKVWQRVMAGRTSCPITWETPEEPTRTGVLVPQPTDAPSHQMPDPSVQGMAPIQGATLAQQAAPAQGTDTMSAEKGALAPVVPCRDTPGHDLSSPAFLGPDCLDSAPLLQTLIRQALADWRGYQLLARRASGAPARTLMALAGEKKRQAKALSAAYFLISGIRYWPEGAEHTTPSGSYLGALRQRFLTEQETMASCLAGAEGTEDPCLRQLLHQHAQSCWDAACRVRTLVEQA